MENSEDAEAKNYLPGDPELIDKIVFQLKLQGLFDEFRKECLADVDTKPAYQNLRQRVDNSVTTFLNGITWSPSLNKKNVRENLRKHVYDCRYLDMGVERIVEQVVNPKICSVFMPKVEEVVYQFLGIKVEPKPETEALSISNKWSSGIDKIKPTRKDSKHSFSNIKGESHTLLPGELEPISPEHDVFSDNEGAGITSRVITEPSKIKEEVKDINSEGLSPPLIEAPIKQEKVDDDTSPAFEPHHPRKDGDISADSELSGISDLTSLGSPKQNNSVDINESPKNESANDEVCPESEIVSQKTLDIDESEPTIDASAISPLTSSPVGSGDSPREKIVYDEQMFDEICASYSAQDNKIYDDRFDEDKSSDSDGFDHLRINDSGLCENKSFIDRSSHSSDDEKSVKADLGSIKNTITLNDSDFLKKNSNFIRKDEMKERSISSEKKPTEVSHDEIKNKITDDERHSVNADSQLEVSEEFNFPKTPTIHYENSSGSIEFETVGELKESFKKNHEKTLTLEENSVASFEDCLLKSETVKVGKQTDESSLSFGKQTEESNFSVDTDNNSRTSIKDNNFSGKISAKHETSKLYELNSKEKERKHSHHSHKSSPSSRKDSSSSSKEHRRSHSSKSSSKDGRDMPSSKDCKDSKASKEIKDHHSFKDSKESKHPKELKEYNSSKEVKMSKDGKELKSSKDSKSTKDIKEGFLSKEKLEDVSSKDTKAHQSSKEREKWKDSKSHSSSVKESKESSRHSSKHHRSRESSSKDSSSTSSDKSSSKDHHSSSSKESHHHSDKNKLSKEMEKKNHSSKDVTKDKHEIPKKTDDFSKKLSDKSKDHKKLDKIHKDRKKKEQCSSMTNNNRESRRSSDRDNDGGSSSSSHHNSKSAPAHSTSEVSRGEEPPKKSHKSSHKQAGNSSNPTESSVNHSGNKTFEIIPVLRDPLPDTNSFNNLAVEDKVFTSLESDFLKTDKDTYIPEKSHVNVSNGTKNELFKVGNLSQNSHIIFDKVPKIILERCSHDSLKTALAGISQSTSLLTGQLNKPKEMIDCSSLVDFLPPIKKLDSISQVRNKIKKRKRFQSFDSVEINEEDIVMDPEYLGKINAAKLSEIETALGSKCVPSEAAEKLTGDNSSVTISDGIEEQKVLDKNVKRKRDDESSSGEDIEIKKRKKCEKYERLAMIVENSKTREETQSDKSEPFVDDSVLQFESGRNSLEALATITIGKFSLSSSNEAKRSCDITISGTQEIEITNYETVSIIRSPAKMECQQVMDRTSPGESIILNSEKINERNLSESAKLSVKESMKSNPGEAFTQLDSEEIIPSDPLEIVSLSSSKESVKSEHNDSLTLLNSEKTVESALSDLVTQVSDESMKFSTADEPTQLITVEMTMPDPSNLVTQLNNKESIKSQVEVALTQLIHEEIMNPNLETELNREDSMKTDLKDAPTQVKSEKSTNLDSSIHVTHSVSKKSVTNSNSEEVAIKLNSDGMIESDLDLVTQMSHEKMEESDPKDLFNKLRSFLVSKFKTHRYDEVLCLDPNINLLNFINSQFINFVNNFEEQLRNDLKTTKVNFTTDYLNFDSSLDSILRNDFHFEVSRKSYINVPEINESDYLYDKNANCYILTRDARCRDIVPAPNNNTSRKKGSDNTNYKNMFESDTTGKKIRIHSTSSGESQVSHRSLCSSEFPSVNHNMISGSIGSSLNEWMTPPENETQSPSKSFVLHTSSMDKIHPSDCLVSPKYDGSCSTDDSSIPNTPNKALTTQLIVPALESLLAESGLASHQSSENHSTLKNSNSIPQDAVFSLPPTPESDSAQTHVSPQKSNNKRNSGESNTAAKRKPSPARDKNVPPMKQRNALVEPSLGKLQRYDSSDLYKPRPLFSQTSRRARSNNQNGRDSIGVENESDNPLNAGILGKKR